jgi:hypothetical protein
VATFTVPPECTKVYIVLLVARMAICCQRDLGDVLGNVTGVAIEAAVCAGERVARLLIMIESPSRPTIRVVAERTVCPEAPLMMLVAVAGGARQGRILEPR